MVLSRPLLAAEVLQCAVALTRNAQFERGRGLHARKNERDLGIPKVRMRGGLA